MKLDIRPLSRWLQWQVGMSPDVAWLSQDSTYATAVSNRQLMSVYAYAREMTCTNSAETSLKTKYRERIWATFRSRGRMHFPRKTRNAQARKYRERKSAEIFSRLHDTINLFFKTAISILVISNHSNFWVLFDKIAAVYFIWKVYLY